MNCAMFMDWPIVRCMSVLWMGLIQWRKQIKHHFFCVRYVCANLLCIWDLYLIKQLFGLELKIWQYRFWDSTESNSILNKKWHRNSLNAFGNCTEAQFAKAFSDADMHIFVYHPHQGNIKNLMWDMVAPKTELVPHLSAHLGFPTGLQVQCPIFLLLDKISYIEKCSKFPLNT